MNEVFNTDIWQFHSDGSYIVIPTNGSINSYGEAVMGRGLALQAKLRYSSLPALLAWRIKSWEKTGTMSGNRVHSFPELRLFTFPVKYEWREPASTVLIEKSAAQLKQLAGIVGQYPVYLPRVGCGNGRRSWAEVEPILSKYLDDKFVVVNYGPNDGT